MLRKKYAFQGMEDCKWVWFALQNTSKNLKISRSRLWRSRNSCILILSDGATKNKHSWARAIGAILSSVFLQAFLEHFSIFAGFIAYLRCITFKKRYAW